jgi:hypothetical protein
MLMSSKTDERAVAMATPPAVVVHAGPRAESRVKSRISKRVSFAVANKTMISSSSSSSSRTQSLPPKRGSQRTATMPSQKHPSPKLLMCFHQASSRLLRIVKYFPPEKNRAAN